MKKILLLLSVFAITLSAQTTKKLTKNITEEFSSNTNGILAWIYFTDKGNDSDYYLSNPGLFLSERAIKRRLKSNEKSNPIDLTDIPLSINYLAVLEQKGIKIKQKSKWFNAVSSYLTQEQALELAQLPFIKKIDLVKKFKTKPLPEEDGKVVLPPIKKEITSLDYGASFTQLDQMNVPPLHDEGLSGAGVLVCLMDAGFNLLAHETFNQMTIIDTWDFVNDDPDVGDGSDMGTGSHGTQTLSTIGGYSPGNLIGPAYGADYLLAKTENTDSETPVEEDNWIAALEWADAYGVDVTSTSLGYITFDSPFPDYTWEDMDGNTATITIAADLAVKKGIVVVNSAGNEGYNSTHNTLGAPADGDSVLAIGAVTSSGSRSSFSSVGNTVDGRIKPDLMAMGSSVTVASTFSTTGYTTASGTSFSCPLAAGVVALLLEYNPDLTPIQINDLLRSTASNAASPNREFGWGIINALEAKNNAITPDSTPPDKITDLTVSNITSNSISIQWTVPNDTTVGGVRHFDIRYSNSPITSEVTFDNAIQIPYNDEPGQAGSVESVTLDGQPFSTQYYFAIKSADYFMNWSQMSNVAQGQTYQAPDISVTPSSVSATLPPNETQVEQIQISNTTGSPSTLDYQVVMKNNTFPEGSIAIVPIPVKAKSHFEKSFMKDKNIDDIEMGGQSIQASGGPDNYGYEWIDSDSPEGPDYIWNDIASTGTEITNWIQSTAAYSADDEGYAGPININFNFKYYGQTKTKVYVSTNGFLSFSPITEAAFSNRELPDPITPNDIIAGFWDDLINTPGGKVYYRTEQSKLIIQYTNWEPYSGTGTFTFQYVISANGSITVYYKTMNGTLNSCSVGIENGNGTDGLQVAYNSIYLKNNFALKFHTDPEWLELNNTSGRIYNSNSVLLQLTMFSADYPEGVYSMDVEISSNDPDENPVMVPVQMIIDGSVPVELSNFSADINENNVLIKWKTITETNNQGFSIERKTNSLDWNEIIFIDGKGNSSEHVEYNYIDKNLEIGKYSYRLKQLDLDGSFTYSNVIEAEITAPDKFELYQNYPNPFNPVTQIKFTIPEEADVKINLYDITGRLVKNIVNQKLVPGIHYLEIDGTNLASGVYIVRMQTEQSVKQIKINLIK
ncbi:MAG: S8 family serine peptidase [Melioribacteraceae bacterium]|nr:S8 family serine peptidase [Melioribacteraceae bacterium]MDD3557203.1 S8 family serine peptidase [Melioribacteraceae bacterium]